jgi:hypothetical protein
VTDNISKLEFEVAEARAKLARDLAFLRSPQTYRKFTAGLKSEAQSVVKRVGADLKARAAANPSAALAIGAGLAWRLLKHPPIATALVGAGVLSLWRTTPIAVDEEDYLTAAQQRFGEQIGEAVETVKEYAAETAVAAREQAGIYAKSAGDTIERLAASATEKAAERIENGREAAAYARSQFDQVTGDEDFRDKLLLGVAGLAVAAALGIAYDRRD